MPERGRAGLLRGRTGGCRDVTTSCFVFQLKSSVPASSCFTRGLRQLLLTSLSACVPSTGHTWVSLMQGHR